MAQRCLHPFGRFLVFLLSSSLAVGPSYAQVGQPGGSAYSSGSQVEGGMPSIGLNGGQGDAAGLNLQPSSSIPRLRSPSSAMDDQLRWGAANSEAGRVQPLQANTQPPVRPLPPNEFQRYVLETSGQALPLFGTSYFSQGAAAYTPPTNVPVSPDYRVGPGDELQIRGWGSVDIDVRAVVDRDGMIHLPRVGSVNLSGIRSAQAEDVIRAAIGKYYKDFQLSVTMGQLRGITVYVVGQARKPGSYLLSSTSTLVSALFASGGPNQNGSMRHVQVKRGDKVVTELDLYAFLAKGDKSADVKLQDGDTIVIPAAKGFVALFGKVSNAAVYELSGPDESIGNMLAVAGGMPVVADPKRAQLERLDPSKKPARSVDAFALDAAGLARKLRNGDILTVMGLLPQFSNAVTLRGNVAQPMRSPWKEGMRISDMIPNKAFLMSRASVKRQNDVLLTDEDKLARLRSDPFAEPDGKPVARRYPAQVGDVQSDDLRDARDNRSGDRQYQNAKTGAESTPWSSEGHAVGDSADTLAQRIGNLVDEVNLDYAVIERVDADNVSVKLLSFNLGNVLNDPNSADNLLLQPGDVITVFSVNDVRVPQAKRQIFVRVEGEVQRPGIYQMHPGDGLHQLIDKAGGLTADAYLFGAAFYREEVKRAQTANLQQLVRRLESQIDTRLSSAAASVGSTDAAAAQLRIQAETQAQKQAVDRLRNLEPSGRIMLSLSDDRVKPDQLPALRLENLDRLVIPARPDFVYVLGSVNTEASLIWREGTSVQNYLDQSGVTSGADLDEIFVLRADGSVLSNNGRWFSSVLGATVLPGDVIVLPEKTDHESAWSVFTRNAKDITQIVYQFSLGAAAIKTLRQ